MRKGSASVGGAVVAGIFGIGPIHLAVPLLLKAIKSLMVLLKPLAGLLPDWLPGEEILSLLLVLV